MRRMRIALAVIAVAGAVVLGVAVPVAPARADTFKLTSLDWPPYSGEALRNGGTAVARAKAAFAAAGHTLEVDFYPWKRAVQVGMDEGYVGYFPEYYSQELDGHCAFSDPMGSGPLGFAENPAAPVTWGTLDDLKDFRIGTVSGYVNTAEFDARAASGALTVDPVSDDLTNLRKVAGGRLPLAVIDANVMSYLVEQNPDLVGAVQMNTRLLEDKKLFVCFQNSPAGDEARAIFNKGIVQLLATR